MATKKTQNEKFEQLCAGYVLNALERSDHKEFERMLADATDEQKRLYQELRSVANQLAFTVENEPSESLRGRLMTRIQSGAEEKEPKNGHEPSASPAAAITNEESSEEESTFKWATFSAAASFALLIVSLSLLFYSFNLSAQVNDHESAIASQQTEITELRNEIRQKEELLGILESPDVAMVLMSGLDVNPDGYGKIIWDAKNQQALIQTSNLPPVQTNQNYQLWIIQNNEPVSAGVFAVNDSSDNFFKIEEMTNADLQSTSAFAITMEPKGGMPQPTGDMYLIGETDNGTESP
ncbi:MAG TPA: anti-sigma factor [Fodinibius sp.]|nr:anti-sigma factor [Fodinibius sp.]